MKRIVVLFVLIVVVVVVVWVLVLLDDAGASPARGSLYDFLAHL